MGEVSLTGAYLREVELALLNAPFDGGWRDALGMIATATHSRGSDLVSLGGSLPSLNIFSGYGEDAVEAFEDPRLWGPCNWRVGSATVPFQIRHDGHYREYRERVDTRLYDEVAFGIDMPFGCQTIFAQDETGFLGLALLRTEREGPCTPESIAVFGRLCRSMARSIKVEATLAGEGAAIALRDYEAIDRAVALVNRHGWLCGMSPEADAMLIAGWPLQSARERLRLADPAGNYRFQQLLGHLLSMPPLAAARAHLVIPGWQVQLTHLPLTASELGFEPMLAVVVTPL